MAGSGSRRENYDGNTTRRQTEKQQTSFKHLQLKGMSRQETKKDVDWNGLSTVADQAVVGK